MEFWTTHESKRGYFSCIVSPNHNLYAIGGIDLASIEYISTINIAVNVWSYTADNFSQPLPATACVMQHENIFIIGGVTKVNGQVTFEDKVYIINSTTNEVSLADDKLVYGFYGSASILLNEKIFVFGGYNGTVLDKWQYISLSSPNPTTADPTTANPTSANPTTDNPTSSNSTTNIPTTANPTMTDTTIDISTFYPSEYEYPRSSSIVLNASADINVDV